MNGAMQLAPATTTAFAEKMEGWSLGVSASIPAAGGTVLVGAAYLDAEAAGSVTEAAKDDELNRWIVSAGYDYPFSKRTDVYGVVTYNQDQMDSKTAVNDRDPSVYGVMVGLRHKF